MCFPRPSLTEAVRIYESDEYYTTQYTAEELKKKKSAYRVFAKRLRRKIGRGARVLELGCGTGVLLAALCDEGLRTSGIDASSVAIRKAKSIFGADVRQALVEDADLPQDLDAIIALHVIEHLREPSVLLQQAHKALRPGGVLVLEVPDFGARMRTQLGERWPYFIPGEHLQHFDEKSLRHICNRFGFRPFRSQRLGGFGILQPGQGHEGVAAAHERLDPPGWRGRLYRSRHAAYRVPYVRSIVRVLNDVVGYRLLHRNSYIRIWAVRR